MDYFKKTSTILLLLSTLSLECLSVNVPKCCPDGQIGRRNCTESPDPRLYPFKPYKDFETYISNINCSSPFQSDEDDIYHVDQSGTLIFEVDGVEADSYSPNAYCFDVSGENVVVAYCPNDEEIEKDEEVPQAYAVCMIMSAVSLVSIAVVYTGIKKLRENPHTPYLVSHSIALALAFTCLVRIQISDDSEPVSCKISGYGVQYFFLASFFWLNSMSVDIFMTLSKMRPVSRRNSSSDRKFLYFSLYSWGCPLLITVGTIVLTNVKNIPIHYRPNVGERKCLLSSKPVRWIYLNGPIAVIITSNILIFVLTAIKLLSHRRAASAVIRNRNTIGELTRQFFLYMKLFILMGLCWSTEILSFVFDKDFKSFWFVTDIVNTLQGVLIFLLFVCKRNVLNLLLDELKTVANLFPSKSQLNRSSKSTTSGSKEEP